MEPWIQIMSPLQMRQQLWLSNKGKLIILEIIYHYTNDCLKEIEILVHSEDNAKVLNSYLFYELPNEFYEDYHFIGYV